MRLMYFATSIKVMLGARFDPTKKIAICESVSDVFILTFFSDSQCNLKKTANTMMRLLSVSLLLTASWAFVPLSPTTRLVNKKNVIQMGFLDDFFPATTPRVQAPDDFVAPEPQPLTLTESADLTDVVKSTAALALRLATGAFVLGWKIDNVFAPEEAGKYALRLGPIGLRDSSSVLGDAPRPNKPLILYEYDASPFCKRGKTPHILLSIYGTRSTQISYFFYCFSERSHQLVGFDSRVSSVSRS